MFFFIAGIQPKTVRLDEQQRRCPSCGLFRARRVRSDAYVSLFFIPLFPVKKGEPFLLCDACGPVPEEGQGEGPRAVTERPGSCPRCGGTLAPGFRFCPRCGTPLT